VGGSGGGPVALGTWTGIKALPGTDHETWLIPLPPSEFPHLQNLHRLRLCDSVVFIEYLSCLRLGSLEDLKEIVSVSDFSIRNSTQTKVSKREDILVYVY
jgi:hypothetical protein